MTFAIGVDGGGSLMRAVIVDERGLEVTRAEAPGAVASERSPGAAVAAVAQAVRAAADRAGLALPASALWAGLSGAGREAARLAVGEGLERERLAERVHVGTDVEAAFHAAFPEGPGVLLIAGTGSIAWARSPRGEVIRVGGWGQLLGDEGSGYAIGLGALRAVARAEDGRAAATSLRERVLGALRLEDPDALIPWSASATKAEVARLAGVVVEAAAGGDAAASALLTQAVAELEAHVTAVLARGQHWPTRPEVVLWGGLIDEGGPLRPVLRHRLAAHPVALSDAAPDAALGAARMALVLA